MGRQTKHRQRRLTSSSKQSHSGGPLFLHMHDETLSPDVEKDEHCDRLRSNIQAWSKYIARLSPGRGMDHESKRCVTSALLRRGIARTLLGEWQEAVTDFTQVIEWKMGEAEMNTAYLFRAQGYDALSQNEASLADWTSVLNAIERASSPPERFPKEIPAQGYASRARLYCRLGNYKQAVAECDRALSVLPTCAEAYSVRGRALSLLNKWSAALADCTKSIELGAWPVHFYRRGLVHKQMGNYNQALADLEQAQLLEPANDLFKQEYTDVLMLRLAYLERLPVSPHEELVLLTS